MDEVTLRSFVRGRIASLVAGAEPGTITDVLAQYALENLEQELTEHHIWTHLRSRTLRPREWSRDISVVQSVASVTERFLGQLRREVIPSRNGPIVVPREETKIAVERIVGPGAKSGVLLSGTAGVGKSGVLLQVTEGVARLGWPILAFRADHFDDPYVTADQLGVKLGLPGSPAPVLAARAHGRDCLLVIDQLDAVSLASGRAAQLFDCIEDMLQQVRGFPKMRVLLACRAFDLDNDDRLHQLTNRDEVAEGVPVQGLPEASVREIVGQLGFDPAALTTGQLELFSAPLHLRLLSESGTAQRDLSAISTGQDLYRHYWSRKQQQVRQRLGREPRWTDVVDALVDYVSDRQSGLAAPKEVVDSWSRDASAMASEHVLVEDGGRYALFHETLFDFAFALRFIARGKSLIDLLLGDEQHLFRRAQLRQLLAYQRSVDFDEYLANVSAVLLRSDIRFHLKDVAFAWLSSIADPRPEEWALIEPLIFDTTYTFNRHAWLMLLRSPAWTRFLDRQGVLVRWLRSADETVVNATVSLLANMQQHQADRVAGLLEPFVEADPWHDRLVFLVQRADLTQGRRFVELVARLIDQGTLDGVRGTMAVNADFWSLLYPLAHSKPEWAVHLVASYFSRALALAKAAGHANPFEAVAQPRVMGAGQSAQRILSHCAEGAPREFVLKILPFVIETIGLNLEPSSDRLNPDRIWPLHYFGEAYQVDDALLVSMKAALGRVARDFPQDFRRLAHELLPSTSETVQLLLMSAYAAAGQSFADAAEHLLSKPACFEVGYWNGGSHWAARQLLEAITGYCSEENLRRLEDFILNYYPVTERGAGAIFGRAQQVLLDGIDANRISARVRERQQQLERKFPVHSTGPRPVVFHEVRSPVPERAIEHMSDEQWLQAVAKYSGDQMNATATGFTGGVHELGQLLETQARREPERFALLSDRFPPGTNSGYFSAVLRALSGSGIPTDLHLRVWRACHHLPRRPCGHSLPDAIASVSDRPLPEEALAIVAWYATEDPSPMTDTWDDDSRYQGRWPLGERIATEGINSVRGRATRAMGQLILADASRLNFFSSTLERIASDQSLAVRVCLTWTLSCAAIHNEELATMVFLSAAEKSDMLLAGTWAEDFVWRVARRQFTRVSALLERCLTSSTPAVQTAAARQVCVVALGSSQGSGLVEQVIQGAPPLRKGAAEIFAATVADSALRPLCEQRLAELFNDPEADVRSAASSCFRHFNGSALDGAETLIASFTDSQAFLDHYAELLHAIQRSSARLPAATCNACERFIDIAGMDAGDIRTAAAADAHIVSQLIIRLYSQASDAQLKSRCLEIIDKMSAMKAYGIAEALSQYER